MSDTPEERIDDTPVADELETSFLAYAMSVIVSRALPDVRDGLKPVHRRLLHSMQDLNLTPANSHVKSARVVGDCIGRFHPHGDSAVYEALVRMAQDFSMGVRLVDGHGNFGTHNDPAAAMRYCIVGDTPIRMADGSWSTISDLASGDVLDTGDHGEATHRVALDITGKSGEAVTASRWFNSGTHPVFTLTTTDGHKLTGTSNHPVLTVNRIAGVPIPAWKLLEELRAGDIVVMHKPGPDQPSAGPIDNAAARSAAAAGALLARGDHSDGNPILRPIEGDDADVTVLTTLLEQIDETGADPRLFKTPLADRSVPDWVFYSSPALQDAFLAGVAAAAGSSTKGVWKLHLASTTAANGLATLLLGRGVATRRVRDGRGGWWLIPAHRDDFAALTALMSRVAAHGIDAPTLAAPLTIHERVVPFAQTYRAAHAADTDDVRAEVEAVLAPLETNPWHYTTVASVKPAGLAPVYSLRVDTDDHAFITAGFVSHNTECRMSHAAVAMTDEIDENTVDMGRNYDGKLQEPTVLPAAFPNLLVNGSEGIAVGMATKMPPHNLHEVVAACQHLLAHPEATVEDLIKIVPAPDLPTGGLLLQVGGAQEAYRTGKGTFKMRARTEIVGRDIVVTELPYQVGPENVFARIKALRDAGKLDEVSSAVDLSDRRHGMRLVITAKRTSAGVPVNPEAVLRKLFKYSPLEESFAIHFLALVDGQPRTLTLLEMVTHYVNHRLEVTRRRCEHRRSKAEARAHLLEGYLVALAAIDEVVAVIRSSRDTDTARTKLMKQFKLSEIQASNILEMPLRRLTSLEVKKIKDELAELKKKIAELTRYLTDDSAMRGLVSSELGETAAKLGGPRRSTISSIEDVKDEEEPALAVPDVPCRVQLTTTGKLGRFGVEPHKGTRTKDDALRAGIEISVRSTIGVITDSGRLLHLHPMDIPVCEGRNKGMPVTEFVADIGRDENVIAFTDATPTGPVLAVITEQGFVKKTAAKDFAKASGQPVIGFKNPDDSVVAAFGLPAGREDEVDLVLVTAHAQLLRFTAGSVRNTGRTGGGVAGIKLADGDRVIAAAWAEPVTDESTDSSVVVATVSDAGGTKWTPVSAYPSKGRATGGVRCQRMGRGEEHLVSAAIGEATEVMLVAKSGALSKLPSAAAKRDAMGERLDAVAAVLRRP